MSRRGWELQGFNGQMDVQWELVLRPTRATNNPNSQYPGPRHNAKLPASPCPRPLVQTRCTELRSFANRSGSRSHPAAACAANHPPSEYGRRGRSYNYRRTTSILASLSQHSSITTYSQQTSISFIITYHHQTQLLPINHHHVHPRAPLPTDNPAFPGRLPHPRPTLQPRPGMVPAPGLRRPPRPRHCLPPPRPCDLFHPLARRADRLLRSQPRRRAARVPRHAGRRGEAVCHRW